MVPPNNCCLFNPNLQKIKDRYLVLGVAFLVAIDMIIIIVYMLVEGIQSNLVTQQVTSREKPMKIEGVRLLTIQSFNFMLSVSSLVEDRTCCFDSS